MRVNQREFDFGPPSGMADRRLVGSDALLDRRHLAARSAADLADWLAWLELGGTAPATLDAYERTCADLLRTNLDVEFKKFRDSHLMKLLMGYPEKSRRTRKAHLASWFRWGYRTRRIPANPVDLLPVIKARHQPVEDFFTAAEVAALVALPSPDGHLAMLLFEAGLRLAEAVHLTGRRVDFDRRLVIVKEGAKGSKDRVVPMVKPLAIAMANLFLLEGIGKDDYLWYDKPGGGYATNVRRNKPIAGTSFRRWWARCCEDAGVDYRRPHLARHTCASTWRARGLDLDEIQKMLGHASVKTTSDLYVHTGLEQLGVRMDELYEASVR